MLYAKPEELVTRTMLHEIEIPDRTGIVSDIWTGINHGVLADTIIERLHSKGIEVVNETWKTNKSQTDLFGAVDVSMPDFVEPLFGQQGNFTLGVRHSNVGRYAVTFAVGGRVAVCENGLITGDFALMRRHTKGVKLAETIDSGIDRYVANCQLVNEFVERMRNTPIAHLKAADLILESARIELLPWADVKEVDAEWRNPSFEEFEDRSAWSLYNAFTYVAKKYSGSNQMRVVTGLRDLFNPLVELEVCDVED